MRNGPQATGARRQTNPVSGAYQACSMVRITRTMKSYGCANPRPDSTLPGLSPHHAEDDASPSQLDPSVGRGGWIRGTTFGNRLLLCPPARLFRMDCVKGSTPDAFLPLNHPGHSQNERMFLSCCETCIWESAAGLPTLPVKARPPARPAILKPGAILSFASSANSGKVASNIWPDLVVRLRGDSSQGCETTGQEGDDASWHLRLKGSRPGALPAELRRGRPPRL